MNIYIWKNLLEVTSNYHPEGGLAVVARSLDHAKEVVAHYYDDNYDPEWSTAPRPNLDIEPDAVYTLANEETPRVFVFPNAGCC